jgi:hypothetical protein
MADDIIELPVTRNESNFPVTHEAIEALKRQRSLLRSFVQSQLKVEVDFGIIPGTDKNSLYKPGAEKVARLFGLGVRMKLADRVLDREGNFAMFTYQAEVYFLQSDSVVIAQCEGSCNSQEKKYRERRSYEWVNAERGDGSTYRKKVETGSEATPVCDVMNTLQKMAQKRAYVGAVILATGASDFFTQDIDDPEDAAQLGIGQRVEPQRAKASVPKATAAVSQNQAAPVLAESTQDGPPICELCRSEMRLSRNGDAYTCPNWKDQANGRHSYVPVK